MVYLLNSAQNAEKTRKTEKIRETKRNKVKIWKMKALEGLRLEGKSIIVSHGC